MSVIDDLQILVTADASGIESVLNKTIQTVTGTVNNINSQEVDWTSIFTASVSPAIIAGVASMFAYAIGSAVNFQAAMAQAGTAAGDTASQTAAVGQAAIETSDTVPASAQDVANAMLALSAIFPNLNDQQQIAAEMAELSASGFGDLNDIVSSSIPIFQQLGVTTEDQAVQVLTDLMNSAEGAKESIPALTSQFTPFLDTLPEADKNVSSFNVQIAAFASEVKNLGAVGTEQIFQVLAASSASAAGPMELLGTSFAAVQKSLLTDGGLTAIKNTSDTLLQMGPGAALVATNFGLSAQQVAQFQTNAAKLPQVTTDANNIATSTQTIADAWNQSSSDLRTFQTDWNTLKNSLIPLGDIILKGLNEWVSGDWIRQIQSELTTAFKNTFSTLSSTFNSEFTLPAGMTNKVTSSDTSDSTPVSLITALNNLTTAITNNNPSKPTINFNLSGGTAGMTNSQLQQILYNISQGASPN